MTSQPRISVVIPAYNRADTIARAIRSVLGQSFADFELIVVDDGSADALEAALAPFADPRLKLLRHERNRGAAAARNTAIRASRGELVAFLDSDDEWLPDKLARQEARLAAAGDPARLSLSGYMLRREGRSSLEARPLAEVSDWYLRLLLVCDVSFGSCALVRRDAFTELGLLDETLQRFEDWDWLLRYCAKRPIAALSEPLAVVHMAAAWPSVAAVDASVARISELHREEAARHSRAAKRLLRSTISFERGVARARNHRPAAAAWYLSKALLLYPPRLLRLWRRAGGGARSREERT